MEDKYLRVLAILWHWDPLREKRRSFDTLTIQETSKSLVCRLQHGRHIQVINKDMARCANMTAPGGKLLMMIHRDSLNTETYQELKNTIERTLPEGASFDWKVFSGGDDYIYYDGKRDTGLLNQEGDFVIDDSYEYFINDGARQERLAAVAVLNRKNEPTLKKKYFEQVWCYYHYEYKKKIYELERDLLLYFAPFTDPEYIDRDRAFADYMKANEPLVLRLKNFVEKNTYEEKITKPIHGTHLFSYWPENLKAAYGPQALEAYENLKQSIYNIFLNNIRVEFRPHIALLQIRQQFVQLRSFMPEKITY